MADIEVQLKNSLRSLRTKLGYTQEESAKLLGISAVTLRAWEAESGNITFGCIKKIEQLYKTKQEYIYFGNESEFMKQLRESPFMLCAKMVVGIHVAMFASKLLVGMIVLQGIAA